MNNPVVPCMFCGGPATIHLTQIINNHTQKVNVCETCAKQKGVLESEVFSMANLFAKAIEASMAGSAEANAHLTPFVKGKVQEIKCGACGFNLNELKNKGQLGCPECYSSFKKELHPIMQNMHAKTKHVGKKSHTALSRAEDKTQMNSLQNALASAIKEEHFEEAARIRDEIKKLKAPAIQPAKKVK